MSSKTILMIHGMWCGDWCFHNFEEFFSSKGFKVTVPVLRYHDTPTDRPDEKLGGVGIGDYVTDLCDEISQLEEKPIVFGHSMGGLIAQLLLSRGVVERIVLIAPAAPRGVNSIYPSVVRSFASILLTWEFWKKPVKITYNEASYAMLSQVPHEQRQEIYSRFVFESGRAIFQIGFWFLDDSHSTRANISEKENSILIVRGLKDKIIPPRAVRKIHKRNERSSTLFTYPAHGHWIISEPGWEDVCQDIYKWLVKNN